MPRKTSATYQPDAADKPLPPLAPPAPVLGGARAPIPVQEIPVSDIAPWADNPRRFSDEAKFRELVRMVEAQGVLQNIVLRPHPSGPELCQIVCGERRWRAAIRTGLKTIPAAVRVLSDREAFELAVVENVGREDMSPVDEARAYRHMMTTFGYSPDDVAAKVGKAAKYIHQRVVLCNLAPKALDWLRDDLMTLGGAVELARVATEVQTRFLEDLEANAVGFQGSDAGGAMNALEVRGRLRNEYLRGLLIAKAPFSTSDPDLVPAAGSCSACPKNTASQRLLFGETKDDAAACLDADCWRRKVDAGCAAAVKAGAQLLEGPEAAKVLTGYGDLDYKAKLKPLSETCYVGYAASQNDDDGESDDGAPAPHQPAHRTYGDLLQPALAARPEELIIVRNPKNPDQVFQCVREERLAELLKESGQAALAASREKQTRPQKSASQQKQEEKAKAEELARREALGLLGAFVDEQLGKGCTQPGHSFDKLEALLREIVSLVWTKKSSLAAKRRGLGEEAADRDWDVKKPKADPRLAELGVAALTGFLVELVVEERAAGSYPSPRVLNVLRRVPDVDLDALAKRHMQGLRAKKAKKK
jgi:ParB/RepB/Spo0J family partition protein